MTFKELKARIDQILAEEPRRNNEEVFLKLKMRPEAKIDDQNARLVSVAASTIQPTVNEPIIGEIIVP